MSRIENPILQVALPTHSKNAVKDIADVVEEIIQDYLLHFSTSTPSSATFSGRIQAGGGPVLWAEKYFGHPSITQKTASSEGTSISQNMHLLHAAAETVIEKLPSTHLSSVLSAKESSSTPPDSIISPSHFTLIVPRSNAEVSSLFLRVSDKVYAEKEKHLSKLDAKHTVQRKSRVHGNISDAKLHQNPTKHAEIFCFGIGLDIFKIRSIRTKGLLPESSTQPIYFYPLSQLNIDAKNGKSPPPCLTSGISFMLCHPSSDDTPACLHPTGMGDYIATGPVAPENLVGILTPTELLEKSITELPFFQDKSGSILFHTCRLMYAFICEEYGITDISLQKNLNLETTMETQPYLRTRMRNFLLKGIQTRWCRSAATIKLLDLIRPLVEGQLSIYALDT